MEIVYKSGKTLPFGAGLLTVEDGYPDYSLKWSFGAFPVNCRFVYSSQSERLTISSLVELAQFAKTHSIRIESEISPRVEEWARLISDVLEVSRPSAGELDHFPIIDVGHAPWRLERYAKMGLVYEELKPVVSDGYLIWHAMRLKQKERNWIWVLLRFKCCLEKLETDESVVRPLESPN